MISSIINKILGKIMAAILNFVFNYIVSPILHVIMGIITAIVSWYFYEITVFMLTIVDFLFDMFQMLAGLKPGLVFTGLTDLVSGEVYGMDNAKDQDILIQLFTSEELFTVFIGMITVGLFLLFIFTIAKIIKVEFTTQGSQNAKGPILKKFLKALFNMLFTPVICVFAIILSNEMLQLISTAFLGNSEDLTLSGVVFTSGCYNAVYDRGEIQVDLVSPVTSAISGGINTAMRLFEEGMKSFGAEVDLDFDLGDAWSPNFILPYNPDKSKKLFHEEAKFYYSSSITEEQLDSNKTAIRKAISEKKRELIFDCYTFVTKHNDFVPFYGETTWANAEMEPTDENVCLDADGTKYTIRKTSEWSYEDRFKKYEGYIDTPSNLGVLSIQERMNKKEMAMLKGEKYPKLPAGTVSVYGIQGKKGGLIDISEKELFYTNAEGCFLQIKGSLTSGGDCDEVINAYRVYYSAAQVSLDFNSTKINYAFIIFTSVILMKVLLYSSIGMIMRLYKCTILFLIVPGPISMSPLDDGASFKKWQKKFMSTVMAAYSVVIAINVYLTIARLFLGVKLVYQPSNYGYATPGITGVLAQSLSLLASGPLGGIVLQCIFVIVGGLMVEKFCGDFASLFGVDNPLSEGKGMFNKMMEPIKKAGKLVATAAIIVASVYTGGGAAAAAKGAKAAASAAKAAQTAKKGAQAAKNLQNHSKKLNDANKIKGNNKGGPAKDSKKPDTTTGDKSTTQHQPDTNNATQQQPESVHEEYQDVDTSPVQDDEATHVASTDTHDESGDTSTSSSSETSSSSTTTSSTNTSTPTNQTATPPPSDSSSTTTTTTSADGDTPPAESGDGEKAEASTGGTVVTNDGGGESSTTTGTTSQVSEESGDTVGVVEPEPKKKLGARLKEAGPGLKGKLAKALSRERDTMAQMAKNTLMSNLPGMKLFGDVKKSRDKSKKDLLKNDLTYKKVAENVDKLRQARINKRDEERHIFENSFDTKQLAKAFAMSIREGFSTYENQLIEQCKKDQKVLDSMAATIEEYRRQGDQKKLEEAQKALEYRIAVMQDQHRREYNIEKGKISLKAQEERARVREEIIKKTDDILNSGVTRSELEKALKNLLKDTANSGHSEAVDIINKTLMSLRDKF